MKPKSIGLIPTTLMMTMLLMVGGCRRANKLRRPVFAGYFDTFDSQILPATAVAMPAFYRSNWSAQYFDLTGRISIG